MLSIYPRELEHVLQGIGRGRNVHSSNVYNSSKWESPNYSLTGECINTLWYIYTTKYYKAMKKE